MSSKTTGDHINTIQLISCQSQVFPCINGRNQLMNTKRLKIPTNKRSNTNNKASPLHMKHIASLRAPTMWINEKPKNDPCSNQIYINSFIDTAKTFRLWSCPTFLFLDLHQLAVHTSHDLFFFPLNKKRIPFNNIVLRVSLSLSSQFSHLAFYIHSHTMKVSICQVHIHTYRQIVPH